MKKSVSLLCLMALLSPLGGRGQSSDAVRAGRSSGNWPLLVSVQFHNLSMPFRDLKSAFANVGLSVGTEVRYNQRGNLVQQFQVGYYRNRYAGDGVLAYSQAAYRPHVGALYTELKAGAGWAYSFHPTQALVFRNGEWRTGGPSGKGMLVVPLGLTLGYHRPHTVVSPFVSYQFLAMAGYNPSVPLVPNQLLQVGSRIFFHP